MSTENNQDSNSTAKRPLFKSLIDKKVPKGIDNISDGKNNPMQESRASSNPFIPEKQKQIILESNKQNVQNKNETTKVNEIPNINKEVPTANKKVSTNNESQKIPISQSADNPKDRFRFVSNDQPKVHRAFQDISSSTDKYPFKLYTDSRLDNTTSKPLNNSVLSQAEAQPKQAGVKIKLDDKLGAKRLLSKDTTSESNFHLSKKAKHVHDLMGMLLKEFDSTQGSSSNVDRAEFQALEENINFINKVLKHIGSDYIGKLYFENYVSFTQKSTGKAINLLKADLDKLIKDVESLKKSNFNAGSQFSIKDSLNSSVSSDFQLKIENKMKQLQNDNLTIGQAVNKNQKELTAKIQHFEEKMNESKESVEKYSLALKESIWSLFKTVHDQFKVGLETLGRSKVNKSEFDDRISSLADTTLNSSQSIQKFINSTLEDFENHKKKVEEQLTTTTKFYQNKIKNLETKIEDIDPKSIQKCKKLPFDAVIYLNNYKRKFETEANADILFKPIIEYCLMYGIYLNHETKNDTDYLLTAKYNGNVIFQLPFVFDDMTLKCSPIPGYTLWEVPAVLSIEYKAGLIYNYVVTYSSDVVFAVFLERDLEETQRISRCKSLVEKLGIFNSNLFEDERVIKLLLERLDKDDDSQQMRVSKTILYRKPKLIKQILSKIDEKYIRDLESRNRAVLECVKFHRSALRYDTLEDYKKFEPLKSIQDDKDELNSYKLWELFPDYASALVNSS